MNREPLVSRIYRIKLVLIAVTFVTVGLLLSVLNDWLESENTAHIIIAITGGLSDVLLVTGAIGIAIDFFTGRDREAADTDRTRRVLQELTPDFADAVIQGFRVNKRDLQRVASPELLDDIATNVLSLRLGDDQFAQEIYTDIRDQAIHTPERWYDVAVNVRLSTAVESGITGGPSLFDVLVEWEYTTTPSHAVARFACVSDRDEFHELIADVPATSTWFMTPRPGYDASDQKSYELVAFSVDGEARKIRRANRRGGQIYSAIIGDEVVRAAKPVRIRHTYRTIADPANHRLFLAIAQPARNVSLEVDYSAANISRMSVTDLMPSSRRPYVSQLPAGSSGKELTVDVSGWVQAGTGFTFVWTLDSEESPLPPSPAPTHAKPAA
ncbi:hypothetical protein ACHIPZ_06540 [Antrihabitans sp. NCIMB 15449]|uniref:Uncharacterized protein n=1 Tax=Antrihabitans spumae TaxID=3373370 RepID=A0ABW7JIR8_9NOCA